MGVWDLFMTFCFKKPAPRKDVQSDDAMTQCLGFHAGMRCNFQFQGVEWLNGFKWQRNQKHESLIIIHGLICHP